MQRHVSAKPWRLVAKSSEPKVGRCNPGQRAARSMRTRARYGRASLRGDAALTLTFFLLAAGAVRECDAAGDGVATGVAGVSVAAVGGAARAGVALRASIGPGVAYPANIVDGRLRPSTRNRRINSAFVVPSSPARAASSASSLGSR
jgi:hypothetical protein